MKVAFGLCVCLLVLTAWVLAISTEVATELLASTLFRIGLVTLAFGTIIFGFVVVLVPISPVEAPDSFGEGEVGWVVPANSAPVNPECSKGGRFAVDLVEGNRTVRVWVDSWDSVPTVIGLRAATIWFEPMKS